jgi:hypothetical protein
VGGEDHHLAGQGVQDSNGLLVRAVKVEAADTRLATLRLDGQITIRVRDFADGDRGAASLSTNRGLWDILLSSVTIGWGRKVSMWNNTGPA